MSKLIKFQDGFLPGFLHNRISLICLILYFCFLSFTSIYLVPPTWDEYLDFSGCVGAANHLFAALRGQPTDITTITHDLEWYGNAYLWPAYVLWGISSGIPVKISSGIHSYDQFLASSFSSSIHIVAAFYSTLSLYFYAKILRSFSISRLLYFFAICALALSPFWLANSFWNLKDLPVSCPVLATLYLSINPSKTRRVFCIKSLVVAALLGTVLANKYAYFPLVILSAALYSYSLICTPLFGNAWKTIQSQLIKLGTSTFLVFLFSFGFSVFLTPQVVGNPLYPLFSINYFASHPLIKSDHYLSAQFFASRASYLLTPALVLLALISLISFVSTFTLRRSINRPSSAFGRKTAFAHSFAWLSAALYFIPISISGRVFYGPDLRHLIWLYPLILISLVLMTDHLIIVVPHRIKRLFKFCFVITLLVTVLEVFAIYPHYYSYLGISPYHSQEAAEQKRLILSKYNPHSTPEVQAHLFLECARNEKCAPYLSSSSMQDHPAVSGLTYPINPSYVSAYVRLGEDARAFPIYKMLGYSFSAQNDGSSCMDFSYSKASPLFYSAGKVCRQ